jgi:hypothetical protein
MSGGFSDEAFWLSGLRDTPPADAQAVDLPELHNALLVQACYERRQLCQRLAEDAEAEADAAVANLHCARPALLGLPSDLPESHEGNP